MLILKLVSSALLPLLFLFNSKNVETPVVELCVLKNNWTAPSAPIVVWLRCVKFLSLSASINFHATVPNLGEVASNPADNVRYFIVSVGGLR